nr:hypothetical protein REQ54_04115 [Rhizobium sp. Q54]
MAGLKLWTNGLIGTLGIVFIAAIFIGDIYLGVVFPASMLIALVMAPLLLACKGILGVVPPKRAIFLGLTLVPLAVQAAQGRAPLLEDIALYLPIIYGVITACTIANVWMTDRAIWQGIKWGAIATSSLMFAMIFFVRPDIYLIPGQVPEAWTSPSELVEPLRSPPASLPPDQAPESERQLAPSPTELRFYERKNLARNALGRSNYIAVFLVFALTVALFSKRYLFAALMLICIFLTYSRFGVLCVFCVSITYLLYHRRPTARMIWVCCAACISAPFLAILSGSVPLPTSLLVRFESLQESWDLISLYWLWGAPRSNVMLHMGFDQTWSPHNSVASLALHFGLFGLVVYAFYVWSALRAIWELGRFSEFWLGIFVALCVMYVWSLVEIIVLTPAVEILVATFYGVAHRKMRMHHLRGPAPA